MVAWQWRQWKYQAVETPPHCLGPGGVSILPSQGLVLLDKAVSTRHCCQQAKADLGTWIRDKGGQSAHAGGPAWRLPSATTISWSHGVCSEPYLHIPCYLLTIFWHVSAPLHATAARIKGRSVAQEKTNSCSWHVPKATLTSPFINGHLTARAGESDTFACKGWAYHSLIGSESCCV